jgi:hypothetical protein
VSFRQGQRRLGHCGARLARAPDCGTLAESREYLEKMYYDHSLISDEQVEIAAMKKPRSVGRPGL